jgi:hypothetical protein
MNHLRIACALTIAGASVVSSASAAGASTLDDRIGQANHVEAMSTLHHVPARISGLLEFCGKEELKNAVDQKIVGDIMSDGKSGADFVQVVQSLRSYSSGVAMGLKLAVVPPEMKSAICTKTVEMAEKLLKQPHTASNP